MLRVILALWWMLAIFWLLGGGGHQLRSQTAPQPSTVNAPSGWPREVQGFGLPSSGKSALQLARDDALQQAQKALADYLHHHGLSNYQPTTAFVEASLLEGPGHPGPELQLGKGMVAKTWIILMKSPNLAELRRLDRLAVEQKERERQQSRLAERFWLLRRLLLGVVALLAGLFAYIRLDEWTQGRYTRWWRQWAVGGRQ